mmetsp:Transcript_51126/g.109493  ORF Transcript_51126/g.109493 Transcript_51126/m.109493 type:complete len:116 (-) Transcript_51126:179-526(-)
MRVFWLVVSPCLGSASQPVQPVADDRQARLNKRREESLISSLLNCPLCKGKEAVACFQRCRYDDGQTWAKCLDVCVENPLIRGMFRSLLPSEEGAAAAGGAKDEWAEAAGRHTEF